MTKVRDLFCYPLVRLFFLEFLVVSNGKTLGCVFLVVSNGLWMDCCLNLFVGVQWFSGSS